ncbi:endoplasmic reticulum chaperone BiP [Nematocida sp. LUAm3]|nr:endoplasmic reticulum chaperone BiP [Nematocida sp. LUAm3]KAI5175156.1 endoplasmic reticulum chaperone BiP [Nematocida sp. LUAm2]KAI5178172.1 endoplasmic reticulum chaperone BiP [Nematocida sp. LUAm1]
MNSTRLLRGRETLLLFVMCSMMLLSVVLAEKPQEPSTQRIIEEDNFKPKDPKTVVLGIDLGTTFSVVSMYNPEKSSVEIVSYGLGRNTLPSFIKMEVLEGQPPVNTLNEMIASEKDSKSQKYYYYKGVWLKKGVRKLVRPIVGWEALEKTKNEKHSVESYIYRFKPLLARNFHSNEDRSVISETKEQVKYQMVDRIEPSTDKRVIGIVIKDGDKEIGWTTPKDLSAMVLSTLKDSVNKMLSSNEVRKCVVTVPAYFNDKQKKETKDAAAHAGLAVLEEGIINEPTSAAIAYAYTCAKKPGVNNLEEKEFLVFDWGGGTLDVSYLNFADQTLVVKAHTGNNFSGGENVNDRIYNYFLTQMKSSGHLKDNEALDINTTLRLRRTVEEMKIKLCTEQNVIDEEIRAVAKKQNKVPSYREPQHNAEQKKTFFISEEKGETQLSLTTNTLNELCQDLFKNIKQLIVNKATPQNNDVDGLLNKISMSSKDIKTVLYVGGSSRIPGVRRFLMDLFQSAKHCFDLDADTCVSVGAAYHAAAHENLISADDYVALIDALPMHIGIRLENNIFDVIAAAGTQVPTKITRTFATTADMQKTVRIEVGQNTTESKDFKKTKLVGKFDLHLPSNNSPKGQKFIEVIMDVGSAGDILVTAKEKGVENGSSNQLVITQEDRVMSPEEIEEMNIKYEQTKEEEDIWFNRCEAGKKLQEFISEILMKAEQMPAGNRKEECTSLANDTESWYTANIRRKEEDESINNSEALEAIATKHSEVKNTFEILISSPEQTQTEEPTEHVTEPVEEFVPQEDL